MMIDTETYYIMYLKGRNAEQIQKHIRSLKMETGRFKNELENPNYIEEVPMFPSKSTFIKWNRVFLERAQKALADAGGTYKPSQAELKAIDFDNNIPFISKVVFSIGGFFKGYETRTFTLDDEHVYMDVDHTRILKPTEICEPQDKDFSREEFLEGIRDLHLGEWRRKYDLRRFGCLVCDGTQWELEVHFSNGHKSLKVYGDNAYPWNFNELQELLGVTLGDDENILDEEE